MPSAHLTPPRHRRDSLDLARTRTPLVYRDVQGQPNRGTPAASPGPGTPLLWSGARRVPLAVAQSNRPSTAGRLGSCKSPFTRLSSDTSPNSGGAAMMCSGARRSTAAIGTSCASPAVPSSPRWGMPQNSTPRLGEGARRVSLLDGRVTTPRRALAGRPPASPFAGLPVAQPGDPLALGTSNSAFRRPPLRIPILADDEAGERQSPVASPPRSLSGYSDVLEPETNSPEAYCHLAFTASPVPTTPLSIDGLFSGARRIVSISRIAASPPPPKSPGLALKMLATSTSGTAVRLVQARASSSQRAETGSSRVVTPVRRSMRVAVSGPASAAELLEATNYAYAPNVALVPKRDEERAVGDGCEHRPAEDAPTALTAESGQLGQEVRRGARHLAPARPATTSRAAARRLAG